MQQQHNSKRSSIEAVRPALSRVWQRATARFSTKSPRETTQPLMAALPIEIFLPIIELLPEESAIVLSLTCKEIQRRVLYALRLRHPNSDCMEAMPDRIYQTILLNQSLDVTYRLVRLLEKDLPQYLTCSVCKKLFAWNNQPGTRKSQHLIECPVGHRPRSADQAYGCTRTKVVRREVVDLILRAHERGPNFGIPPTIFDHSCEDPNIDDYKRSVERTALKGRISIRSQGRIVDNAFILQIQFECIVSSRAEIESCEQALSRSVCGHFHCPDRRMKDMFFSNGFHASTRIRGELMHCHCCAIDLRMSVTSQAKEAVFAVTVWQKFSHRDVTDAETLSMFGPVTGNLAPLPVEAFTTRDLEALFKSGSALRNER